MVSSFSDIRIGLAYIASNKFIKALFISIGAYYILISPIAFLSPLQVSRSFGNDVWRLGALEVCFSIGMIFGGLSVALLAGKKMKHTPSHHYFNKRCRDHNLPVSCCV